MEDFKDKYDDLIKRGYLVDLYEEDKDYRLNGRSHAFCVSIKKNDKIILNHSSIKSFREALIVASEILQVRYFY